MHFPVLHGGEQGRRQYHALIFRGAEQPGVVRVAVTRRRDGQLHDTNGVARIAVWQSLVDQHAQVAAYLVRKFRHGIRPGIVVSAIRGGSRYQ